MVAFLHTYVSLHMWVWGRRLQRVLRSMICIVNANSVKFKLLKKLVTYKKKV